MQIPKNVIEKAIGGGWNWFGYYTHADNLAPLHKAEYAEIALDPTFWQALGKSLGWDNRGKHLDHVAFAYARKFYDLILQGKPTEEFWNLILTNPTT